MSSVRLVIRFSTLMALSMALSCSSIIDTDKYEFEDKKVLDTGESCSKSEDCISGYCVDSVCCESACDGACQTCDGDVNGSSIIEKDEAAQKGTCTFYDKGVDFEDECRDLGSCISACDGNGACRVEQGEGEGESCLEQGAECLGEGENKRCETGFCVDGVCCDNACDGVCERCDGNETESEAGICGSIELGIDPDDECEQAECGFTGYCNGDNACEYDEGDTSCGEGFECNSEGKCENVDKGENCLSNADCASGYCVDSVCCDSACDGVCETCDGDVDGSDVIEQAEIELRGTCRFYQEGVDTEDECQDVGSCIAACDGKGACRVEDGAGQAENCLAQREDCSATREDTQCETGFCVDGVCCDSACDNSCQRCDGDHTDGPAGICSAIKQGEDPDDECDQDEPSSCGFIGYCDGGNGCQYYGTDTICDDGFACDGSGKCEDINECETDSGGCDPGTCQNTEGSYHCICPTGYTGSDTTSCTLDLTCGVNQLCVTVNLPDDFLGDAKAIGLSLFNSVPVVTTAGLSQASAAYPAVENPFGEDETAVFFRQDLTEPLNGLDDWQGDLVPVIAVFRSSQRVYPEPGIDYWAVGEIQDIRIGRTVELDPLTVERIPIEDDETTPGNEGFGIIACDTVEACDITENICCTALSYNPTCSPIPCDSNWLEHECDGPEDCGAGEVCCGQRYIYGNQCMSVADCESVPPCEDDTTCDNEFGRRCHTDLNCLDDFYCDDHGGCHRVPVDDPNTPGDDRPGYLVCTSDDVCEPGEVCCLDNGGIDSCQLADFTGCTTKFFCDGPEDCAPDEKCCAGEPQSCEAINTICYSMTRKCHLDRDCPGSSCSAGNCSEM